MPFPNWGDIPTWLTAIGTVGVAITAVWIALRSERQIDKRVAKAREDSEAQLRDERAHSAAQILEERQRAQDAEQFTEAWSVQVVGGRMPPGESVISTPENPSERPVAIVVNRGRYTITRVEARFSTGDGFTGSAQPQSYADLTGLPHRLAQDLTGALGEAYLGVLIPGGAMRIIGDAILVRYLRGIYPVVRWTDRWGTCWQHKQGDVRQVAEGED